MYPMSCADEPTNHILGYYIYSVCPITCPLWLVLCPYKFVSFALDRSTSAFFVRGIISKMVSFSSLGPTTRCTDGEIFLARVHLPKSHTHPHHSSFAKQQISMLRRHLITLIITLLVGGLEHLDYFSHHFCGLSSFPFFRTPSFFRGVGQPPTRHHYYNQWLTIIMNHY